MDINPRVDIAFKKIFGVEENKDLLISLINAEQIATLAKTMISLETDLV